MPYCPEPPDPDAPQYGWVIETEQDQLVAEYARLSILEVQELDVVDFLILRRDAYIHALRQSKGGREYLERCWMHDQTVADRAALRELIGGR